MKISNLTDDVEEPGSSDGQTLDASTNPPEGGEGEIATSSNATDEDAGLLDVVRDVVNDREVSADAASSAEVNEAGEDTGAPATTEPDDYSDVPFNKHPRFQALIAEKNSLREDAVRYRNVQSYLDTNNLSADEAANALAAFARAKVDPAGAFAELKPWLQDLLVAAGEILPDDLRQRVEKGELTHDTAMEISRERAKSKSHESRQSFDQQRQQRDQDAQRVRDLTGAADTWEADRAAKDPNFAAKKPALFRELAFLQMAEGKPRDAAGVKAQLKKAYDAVNSTFVLPAAAQQSQKRPATRPVTGGVKAGTVREAPKSTLDIVRANRRVTN
ncbi:hypothetical protein [Rhodopseudomonas pseudopalustris]|uniref:Uncharacterized protein n=1 Tax=Rhodopseudomonas pseudopalustris TaxID=1513892 RepID=A0A1H8WID1_9BRAD|nr:hypothetical protein [Rhodopseudomonas pseudopalustris]SEP27425.1 hypothetical protein SAMN05444123_112123 [Rhodopseudomonas pseudopalustris]